MQVVFAVVFVVYCIGVALVALVLDVDVAFVASAVVVLILASAVVVPSILQLLLFFTYSTSLDTSRKRLFTIRTEMPELLKNWFNNIKYFK